MDKTYTSGFVVGNTTAYIEAAKISKNTEGVASAFNTAQGDLVPTIDAINTWATTGLTVKDAEHADRADFATSADLLDGHDSDYFATSASVTAVESEIQSVSYDVNTLESYFTDGAAKEALHADEADLADAATSAAEADALKTPFDLSATNDYGSVSFTGIDGSDDVVGAFTLNVASNIEAISGSEKAGLAPASAIERALFDVESKIGKIAAFDGPYDTSADIPKKEGKYDTDKIFLVGPVDGVSGDDKYKEYISTSGTNLTLIGDTSVDLSNYYTSAQTDSAIAAAVAAEAARATTAEQANADAIAAEETRATGKESELATAISDEATAARAAEKANADAIETLDAELVEHAADGELHVSIDDRELWNSVSAMATSEEFDALAGRVTTAESNIITLQSDMSTAKTDIDNLETDVGALETTVGNSSSGLVKDVDDLQTSAATLDGKIEAVDDKVDDLKYYGKIIIYNNDGTQAAAATASAASDMFGFKAGTGVELSTVTDSQGNPVVKIAANGAAFDISGVNGISADYDENVWTISGIDATPATAANATKGVTFAAYYGEDNLIHLF